MDFNDQVASKKLTNLYDISDDEDVEDDVRKFAPRQMNETDKQILSMWMLNSRRICETRRLASGMVRKVFTGCRQHLMTNQFIFAI